MRLLLAALLTLAAPAAYAKSTITIFNNDRAPGQGAGGTIAAGATATSFRFTPPAGSFTFTGGATGETNGTVILSGSANAANNGAFRITAVDTATNTITYTNTQAGAAAEPAFAGTWKVGEGFNDPMPIEPVGGNPGTTVGAQRLNAFQYAADQWGKILDSGPTILIRANFDAQTCTATSAVLGSAGATSVFDDFEGAKVPATWYSVALANKLAGVDLLPPNPASTTNPLGAEINSTFNSSLNGNPACLAGGTWYYGFDHNEAAGQSDLLPVLMHEFGHGLGMQSFVNKNAAAGPVGELFLGQTDMYLNFLFDNQTNKFWKNMTTAERATSMAGGRHVVWNGPNVLAATPGFLRPGTPFMKVSAPSDLVGTYLVGEAAFGPPLSATALTGSLALVNDGVASASTEDACEPMAAGSLTGKIAFVLRGTCTFDVKAKTVQAAGAIAMVVADNAAGNLPASIGVGPDPTITIPAVRITKADGDNIRIRLQAGTAVSIALGLDMNVLSGADTSNRALLYTPDPIASGSNVSHFDTSLTPNALMEPSINGDLTTAVDLTLPLFRDIGWDADRDNDLVADGTDNCLIVANANQQDTDSDTVGDACDSDDDNDAVDDSTDNCQLIANADQANLDGDTQGDVCDADDDGDEVADTGDNCPRVSNADQADRDGNHVGDACDDADSDGVSDANDNCVEAQNADQANADHDTLGDVCDADDDNDGVADAADNCALVANADQADQDGDHKGDVCEDDTDGDTVLDAADNCPRIANTNQADQDGDLLGDACDLDVDGDDVVNTSDNCPSIANTSQANLDGDTQGDVCDADDDGDGKNDGADNCPANSNADQADSDGDGVGNACSFDDDADGVLDTKDNCPVTANTLQTDTDGDRQGDVCDTDDDGDSVADAADNCSLVPNPDQKDKNKNGVGDACEPPKDGGCSAGGMGGAAWLALGSLMLLRRRRRAA